MSQLKRSGDGLCHERGIYVAESGAVDCRFMVGAKASLKVRDITSLKHEPGRLTWSGEWVIEKLGPLLSESTFKRTKP